MIYKGVHKVQIILTTRCDLSCKYCYAHKSGESASMTVGMSNDVMDFVTTKLPEGAVVEFFGGEPLLAFDVLENIIKAYPTLDYNIPTNGVSLNEHKFEFLKFYKEFINLTLSLDGDPETHTKNRGVFPDMSYVKRVLSELRSSVRMVVEDPGYLHHNIKYIASLGAKKISVGIPFLYKNPLGYKNEFSRQMNLAHWDTSLSSVSIVEDQMSCESHCNAGDGYIAIAPDGSIYPCNAFYFKDEFKLGDIYSGIDDLKKEAFFTDVGPSISNDVPCMAHSYFMKDKWING